MEWIILEKPYILIILVISVLLNQFDKRYNASKGIITLLSALAYIGAMAFLCIGGAGYHELIVLLMIFLLFNLDIYKDRSAEQ